MRDVFECVHNNSLKCGFKRGMLFIQNMLQLSETKPFSQLPLGSFSKKDETVH